MVYKLLFIHKICTLKYFILKMWNQCCVMLFTFLIYGKEGKYKSDIYLLIDASDFELQTDILSLCIYRIEKGTVLILTHTCTNS
jgi:hypothetical protein